MKRIIIIVGALFALVACGDDASPGKSQDEAVSDVRVFVSPETSDQEIRDLMWSTCDALDENRPGEVVDRLDDINSIMVEQVLDSASQAFCPEHRAAVRQYLESK